MYINLQFAIKRETLPKDMSNRINKPKKISKELVDMMRDIKGITFKYTTEDSAADYLTNVNNYMRTASYRKNYTKVQGGKNHGKYERLDFAYLKELSTIDMYFRFILSKMCLDIEHALKVRMIHDVEVDMASNGFDEVHNFLNSNSNILNSLEKKITSPFTSDLIQKYFTVNTVTDDKTGKTISKIVAYDDCPVWVLVELLSYGEFIQFYKFYYGKAAPISSNLLHLVRSLRNATAHNNCMIANLNRNTSRPPTEIKDAVKQISGLSKSQRQKNLSSRPMLEFVTMLYVYNEIVTEKVKYHHLKELKDLFYGRMIEKKEFFLDNDLIKNSYFFACIMIENLVK